MNDIFAFLEKRFKIFCELGHIDLGCLGVRAVCHSLIELVKRHGFSKIVTVLHAVQLIVKTDIRDAPFFEMFRRKIRGRTTTDNIFFHNSPLPRVFV